MSENGIVIQFDDRNQKPPLPVKNITVFTSDRPAIHQNQRPADRTTGSSDIGSSRAGSPNRRATASVTLRVTNSLPASSSVRALSRSPS